MGVHRRTGGASRPAAAPATPTRRARPCRGRPRRTRSKQSRCSGFVDTPATAVCTIQRPRAECVGMTASGATSSLTICGSWGFVSGRRGPSASHLCYTTPGAGSVGPPTRPPRAVVQQLGARTPSASLPTRAATPAMALGEGRAVPDSDCSNNARWDARRGVATMVGPLVWVAASGPVGTPPASSCPPPFSASARPRARCPLFQGRAFAEQQIHRLCFSRGAMPRLVSEGKNLGDFRAHCVVCVVCPHCATFDQRTGSSGCDNIADLQEMEDARCPQSIVIGC